MSMLESVRVTTSELPEPIDIFSVRTAYEFSFPVPAAEDPRVTGLVGGVPLSFIETYANLAVRHAVVALIENGHWFAEVKGLQGAWGDGLNPTEATEELRQAVVGWVSVRLESGIEVPEFAGFDLNPSRQREQAS